MGFKKNKKPLQKSKQLKGVALKRHEAKELTKVLESTGNSSTNNFDADSDNYQENLMEDSASSITASEYKIGGGTSTTATSSTETSVSETIIEKAEGFILLDTKLLCAYLDTVSICNTCKGPLSTNAAHEKQQGFAVPFVGYCKACDTETTLFLSSSSCEKTGVLNNIKTKTPFEVNVKMVCFARAIGRGQSCLDTFSKCLNLPNSMYTKTYQNLLEYHHQATSKIACESMKNAAQEVRSKYGDEIGVSVDGSWQRRGHAKNNTNSVASFEFNIWKKNTHTKNCL